MDAISRESAELPVRDRRCPACGATTTALFCEIAQVPVHCNLLWPSRDEALHAPKGDLRLAFCKTCGHIFNRAFDPRLVAYAPNYENSLHFSPRFQRYAESLALGLIERYDLHDKDIVEIGCGQGDFLALLCELGGNRGLGFDPSYAPDKRDHVTSNRVSIIRDVYSEQHAGHRPDLVCCRHVLEHVEAPRDLVSTVRRSLGDGLGTVVFFEVPNVSFTLSGLGVWDLIYEHYSYFSASSLSRLFVSCGFEIIDLSESYEGQFLCIEATPGEGSAGHAPFQAGEVERLEQDVAEFAARFNSRLRRWLRTLERLAQAGRRTVIWGAGSKGVTFLNALDARTRIAYAVDVNPRKQGHFLAGTGQQVVPPVFLRDYRPDVVIVMNPIYEGEIRLQTEKLGLTPEFMGA